MEEVLLFEKETNLSLRTKEDLYGMPALQKIPSSHLIWQDPATGTKHHLM